MFTETMAVDPSIEGAQGRSRTGASDAAHAAASNSVSDMAGRTSRWLRWDWLIELAAIIAIFAARVLLDR